MGSVRNHPHTAPGKFTDRTIRSRRLQIDEGNQRVHIADPLRSNELDPVSSPSCGGLERALIHEVRRNDHKQRPVHHFHDRESMWQSVLSHYPRLYHPMSNPPEKDPMRRLIVFAALLALVATACKFETNFGAVINADGSGTIIGEIGVDDEAAELFLEGQDPFDGNELASVPGAQTRQERRGDLTYYIVEVDVDDITDAEQQLINNENALFSNLEITVTDTRVAVSGSASADETLGSDTEGFDPGVLEDAISASVYFTLPGAILSHNADRQDGNTLFWDIPVLGGTLDIQAESDPSGTPASGSSGIPTWAYGVIAAVLLGAVYYFMKGKSEGGQEAASDETPPPPPAE